MIERLKKMFGISGKETPTQIIDKVIENKITYLDKKALGELANLVNEMETKNIQGAFIENGCALGGSAILISRLKNPKRPFYIYDVFGMIPSPGEKDPQDVHERYEVIKSGKSQGIGGDTYYGYQNDLLKKVKDNFSAFDVPAEKNNVQFVQGLYEETLKVDYPVAFAHIDCDWYDSVMVCLKEIVPYLVEDGVLVIDDYYFWPGCKKAVDEFFENKMADYEFTKYARLHIRKKKKA